LTRAHKGTFPILTLTAAMAFGATAMAADLPKEGTFSGTYSGFGTAKVTPVGKDRTLVVWDSNGLTVGKGIWDHVTWHGFGLEDITSGTGKLHGYFVGTDPDGDQILVNMPEVTQVIGGNNSTVTLMLTGGTGKYSGIGGSFKSLCASGLRTAVEGTYADSCANEGSYKLP
jgi:hypothetical protein